jgi:hypothetical protein
MIMASKSQKTVFSNEGAVIMVVDESIGVTDTTHRPLTGEELRRAQELVARREELRRQTEEQARSCKDTETQRQKADNGVTRLD